MDKKIKQISILYVEDDENVHTILLRYLKRRFEKVYSAYDGKTGYEIFQKENPDIIISDIKMPIMDGLEMSKKIREDGSDVPIIIATAYSEIQFLFQAIEIGVDGYINKPIKKDELNRTLNKLIDLQLSKKRLRERDKIIMTMLYLQPCFSILVDDGCIFQMDTKLLTCFSDVKIHNSNQECNSLKEFLESHVEEDSKDKIEKLLRALENKAQVDDKISLKDSNGNSLGEYDIDIVYFEDCYISLIAFLSDSSDKAESLDEYHQNLDKIIQKKIKIENI
jgi:YesN/AraC family two-component response regulator